MAKFISYCWKALAVLISLMIIFAFCDLIAKFAGFNLAQYILSPLSPILGSRKANATATPAAGS